MKITAVICARNEADNVERTLNALKAQTLPLDIILVNDGSTDDTADIARKVGCSVIVNLPFHKKSYVARLELGKVWNEGFKKLSLFNPEYVLVLGADHALPETYVEEIIKRMELNPDIVVSSGRIKGEEYISDGARGSGRVIKVSFWKPFGLRYPVSYGWESWILYKALERGKEVRQFFDVVSELQRPTRMNSYKAYGSGKVMTAVGFYWTHALKKCFLLFIRSPVSGFAKLLGFLHGGVEKLDVAEFVSETQKQSLLKRIRGML